MNAADYSAKSRRIAGTFLLGLAISLSSVWLALEEVAEPRREDTAASWVWFGSAFAVGGILGFIGVRLSKPKADRGARAVAFWRATVVPIGVAVFVLARAGPTRLLLVIWGLLGGAGVVMMIGFWRIAIERLKRESGRTKV